MSSTQICQWFIQFYLQELADLKDRIAKENAEAEAKKAADGPSKVDEKRERESKSALEAAMAATLAEFAPPANGAQLPGAERIVYYESYEELWLNSSQLLCC